MAKGYSDGPVKLHKGLATGKSLSEAESAALKSSGSKKGAKNTK